VRARACRLRPSSSEANGRCAGLRSDMSLKGCSTIAPGHERAFHRILKLARTIADLEGAAEIKTHHLAEAIQ